MTDAKALRLFTLATNAVNRAVDAHGVWCDGRCCREVYRRFAARQTEVEIRGIDWRARP